MSTTPIKNVVITNPSTGLDETRRIGTLAEDVEGLGIFLGMATGGETGPITRYEDGDAYEILFKNSPTSKYLVDKNSFKGYVYKLGGTYLGALIKSISIIKVDSTPNILTLLADGLSEKNTTSSYNRGDELILGKAYDHNGEIIRGTINLTMSNGANLTIKAIVPSETVFPINIVNEEWFWIKSCDNKFLAENDFSDEYKNKIDNLDATDVLLDKSHPSLGTVETEFGVLSHQISDLESIVTVKDFTIDKDYVDDDSIPINKDCLYELDSETLNYKNQRIVGKAYYVAGRLLRVDILEIKIYHESSKLDNLSSQTLSEDHFRRTFNFTNFLKEKYSNNLLEMEQIQTVAALTLERSNIGHGLSYYMLSNNFEMDRNILSYEEVFAYSDISEYNDDNVSYFTFYRMSAGQNKPIISFFW